MLKQTLAIQVAIIALCTFVIVQFAVCFPFPSPLIKPFLPPAKRWPAQQIEQWVETQNFDPGFLEFFARDPERTIPEGENLVSPADGLVQNITFRDGITFLVIGLSFWDVHVVRSPAAGVIKDLEPEGFYYSRDDTKAEIQRSFFLKGKEAPVQQIVTLGSPEGLIRVRLITSYWASRLKVWAHLGEHLRKGQRLGRILLGSTVVLELPGKVSLAVKIGQRVRGGESVIYRGRLP